MVQMPSFHHAESGNTPYVGSEVKGSLRNEGQRSVTKIWPKLGKTSKGSNSVIFWAREACHTSLESSWQGLLGFLWRTDLAASVWPPGGQKEKTLEAPGASALNVIALIPLGAQRYHGPLLPDLRAASEHALNSCNFNLKFQTLFSLVFEVWFGSNLVCVVSTHQSLDWLRSMASGLKKFFWPLMASKTKHWKWSKHSVRASSRLVEGSSSLSLFILLQICSKNGQNWTKFGVLAVSPIWGYQWPWVGYFLIQHDERKASEPFLYC